MKYIAQALNSEPKRCWAIKALSVCTLADMLIYNLQMELLARHAWLLIKLQHI